jgi:hypothetical protein
VLASIHPRQEPGQAGVAGRAAAAEVAPVRPLVLAGRGAGRVRSTGEWQNTTPGPVPNGARWAHLCRRSFLPEGLVFGLCVENLNPLDVLAADQEPLHI